MVDIGDEARIYSPRLKLTGDRYRLLRKTTHFGTDGPVKMSGEFANKRDRIGKMLTRATRDLSVTTNTPQGFRNTAQYGGNSENFAAESGGSTFRSAEMQFYIDDSAYILDAQLRFVINGYRTYERDTSFSAVLTSSSGGSSTPTSGASSASSAAQSGLIGPDTTLSAAGGGVHLHFITQFSHTHGISHTHSVSIGSHSHTVPAHSHAQTYDIFEDSTTPGAITVKLDTVNINSIIGGPFAVTLNQATDVALTGLLTNPGWHTLRFETAFGKGRITPYVLVTSLQLQH